jgi:prevent-host-death family protein
MKTLNISDVRNSLFSLIEEVVQFNQIVVVTRYGKPVARITPFKREEDQTSCYTLRDKPIKMADDFDEPMPELWNAVNE